MEASCLQTFPWVFVVIVFFSLAARIILLEDLLAALSFLSPSVSFVSYFSPRGRAVFVHLTPAPNSPA